MCEKDNFLAKWEKEGLISINLDVLVSVLKKQKRFSECLTEKRLHNSPSLFIYISSTPLSQPQTQRPISQMGSLVHHAHY